MLNVYQKNPVVVCVNVAFTVHYSEWSTKLGKCYINAVCLPKTVHFSSFNMAASMQNDNQSGNLTLIQNVYCPTAGCHLQAYFTIMYFTYDTDTFGCEFKLKEFCVPLHL